MSKIKILSDRIVGYRVGSRVDEERLTEAGVNVRQWLRCGLAERLKPAPAPADEPASIPEEGDV